MTDTYPADTPTPSGKLGTVEAIHYHLLSGGIEFEDAEGGFVHVMLSDQLVGELVDHLAARRDAYGFLLDRPT